MSLPISIPKIVQIDYYVKVNLDAFRQIVDAVGGVDFDVPMDMYWDMSDNGGPVINLKAGMQHRFQPFVPCPSSVYCVSGSVGSLP